MSLALMTTAYGAMLGTMVFTPLAGRLEHHNQVFLETQKQILNKLAILLHYDDKLQDQSNTVHGELAV
jgi:chemotaxis protein MotA